MAASPFPARDHGIDRIIRGSRELGRIKGFPLGCVFGAEQVN